MAKLIAQSGHTLDLPTRRVTLGESSNCDIPLSAGLGLAPVHFEIEPVSDGNYVLRDVSGGAGLTVNDQIVKELTLNHGNVIGAGALRLGFWNSENAPEVAAPVAAVTPPPAAVIPTPVPVPAAPPQVPAVPASVAPPPVPAIPAAPPPPPVPSPAPSEPQPALFIPVASLNANGGRTPEPPGIPPLPSARTEPVAPPIPPVPGAPPAVPPPVPAGAGGPPVAWCNPEEQRAAEQAARMAASVSPHAQAGQPGGAVPRAQRVRSSRRPRFGRRTVMLAALIGVVALGGAALMVPSVRAAITPVWTKVTAWVNPGKPEAKKPAAAPAAAKASPATTAAAKSRQPEADKSVTPKTEHNEVVKRMLTERTISLFQADLSQLIPFYNANASQQSLPPQREMTEAFRKHYGLLLDGFDKLTCLRAAGKDEFVFVLTSPTQVNLESMLGIPPSPVKEKKSAVKAKSSIRIYPVKLTGKVYGAAQYDPFTVLLGRTTWIDAALKGGSGPSLREALCMFPYTAAKNPGALIMVERIFHASESQTPSAFETAVSNLFFKGKGESRLTLTRNPDVKEEIFVEQSSAALKEQASSLFQSVKLTGAPTLADAQAKPIGTTADPGEIITTNEASIIIPDGEALLKEATDSVARNFMSQSPSVELILAAQKAVLNFNQARLQAAPETQTVTSVAEALELLQGGITVTGRSSGRDLVYQIERLEPAQADEVVHLLALEERTRLVFRPSTDHLNGTMLDLAVKARDYRNAELLISLWTAAKFTKSDAQDTASAARKVLEWADKDGARQRLSVGLPDLTDTERENAVALLSYQNGLLTWKPGEEGYRTWLRRINPDPKGDAKRIAGIFSQAREAGAIPTGKINELADAVRLISAGVSSSNTANSGRPLVFKAGNYSNVELGAAARYLRFEGGKMRVIDR